MSEDYSQIELRIAAELSGDGGMKKAFEDGLDIQATTAMKIYGLDAEGVTDDMRRQAKTVNFGIIYGISAFGLSVRLDIPRREDGNLIDQYFEQFPGTKNYMDETIAFAMEHGYVETVLGRRRYLREAFDGVELVVFYQESQADLVRFVYAAQRWDCNNYRFV